jgi:hypothetical protein
LLLGGGRTAYTEGRKMKDGREGTLKEGRKKMKEGRKIKGRTGGR